MHGTFRYDSPKFFHFCSISRCIFQSIFRDLSNSKSILRAENFHPVHKGAIRVSCQFKPFRHPNSISKIWSIIKLTKWPIRFSSEKKFPKERLLPVTWGTISTVKIGPANPPSRCMPPKFPSSLPETSV